MLVNIKKLNPAAIIPTSGSKQSAGYDLHACLDSPVKIRAHETEKIGTGLSVEIPEGYFGAIFARSGLASKNGIRPANCVGVCDCDYRGEYIVPLHNDTDEDYTVNHGDRIAQLIVLPYLTIEFNEVSDLSETTRGIQGFGSTGK